MTKLIHQTAFTETAAKIAQFDVDVANADAAMTAAWMRKNLDGGEEALEATRQEYYRAIRARAEFKAAQQND